MLKSQCRVGMKVSFGREHGEKTLGVITKLNDKKAKVKTLEARGVISQWDAGQEWGVPYNMMEPAEGSDAGTTGAAASVPVASPKKVLEYSPTDPDNEILELISRVYARLSPENLCRDGEASRSEIQATRTECNQKLKGLFIALGREIEASDLYYWEYSRAQYKRSLSAAQTGVKSSS